jgi:group I intron endonuclease
MKIYMVKNKLNGKIYVGKTTQNLKTRKRQHERESKKKKCSGFHGALRKYGLENFKWKILEECNSKHDLNLAEEWYIKKLKSYANSGHGYNLTFGGEGISGWNHTEEVKEKISKASLSFWKNPEYRENMQKRKISEKTRKKISEISLRRWANPEFKEKTSIKIKNSMDAEYRKNSSLRMKKLYENPLERLKQGERVSKNWLVISPSGLCLEIKNLSKFCRENSINETGMWRASKGIQDTYKGWRCVRVGGGSN